MTDILVIGGGIAGLSAAARLAPHASVTLLEAETALGYHASGRSAAVFEENYGAPPVCALSRAGRAYFDEGGYLSPRGVLILARANETRQFDADCAELDCHPITLDRAHEMIPILSPNIAHAAYHGGAKDIDTDRLLQDFAKVIRQNDGQIVTNSPVTDIRHANNQWHVTANETFIASVLLNAAGAWADQIAKLAGVAQLGLTPCRRSVARIPAPGGHDVSAWPVFFGPGESWYAKPDAGSLIVSPADEDPAEPHDAWPEDMTLAEGIDRYQSFVTEPVTRLESSWAGLRTFAPDRALVLGPEPDAPGFYWSAGQGGYGMQTAPAASQLVADHILGRKPQIDPETVAALHPGRFR